GVVAIPAPRLTLAHADAAQQTRVTVVVEEERRIVIGGADVVGIVALEGATFGLVAAEHVPEVAADPSVTRGARPRLGRERGGQRIEDEPLKALAFREGREGLDLGRGEATALDHGGGPVGALEDEEV